MQEVIRLSGTEVGPQLQKWIEEEHAAGTRLFSLEGLSGAGKSTAMRHLRSTGIEGYEADTIFSGGASPLRSWIGQAVEFGAVERIEQLLNRHDLLVVEGPAIWPLFELLSKKAHLPAYKRIYFKRIAHSGGRRYWEAEYVFADDFILELDVFNASIVLHHRNTRPWDSADLIIERNDDE